ncbi:MAG: hypothetical protein IJY69_01240 [Clostridia bacterium]|nr:hypothetical protein [Clostridia bacterium]
MKYYYSSEEIEKQRELDLKRRELMWDEIAEDAGGGEIGSAVSDAVKDLYTIYDDRLVDWTANLYDKGWGSFYASPIGKITEGFVPDVESTHQMLSFIEGSGMLDSYGRSCKEGLPEWMMPQIVYYTKSIQDENGYFYHPHWSKTTADEQISHKSRDLYRCISVLRDYADSDPVYDTPTGEKGDGIGPDEYWRSLKVDTPPPVYAFEYNKSKKAAAISADEGGDKPRNDGSDYLRSHTAYIDYFTDSVLPRMVANPYSTGNEIGETAKQIKAYSERLGPYKYKAADGEKYEKFDGMTLIEISISSLNGIINERTGLWGELREDKPRGTEFCYVNGFMKAMAAYNLWGYPYPTRYLEKVAHALTECLLSDEESPGNICAVYNVWASICRFKQNIELNKDICEKEKALSIVDKILKDKAPEALRNTKRKLEKYKKADGGFGHSYTSGTPSHQGMPVSTGENASDVDATVIGADHILGYIFPALNMNKPPILMPSDWMRCRNMLEAAEPVIKTKTQQRQIEITDKRNPIRALGAKFSYCKDGGLSIDFSGGGATLGLTANLFGGAAKIFDMTFDLAESEDGSTVTVALQSCKDRQICSFILGRRDGAVFAQLGDNSLKLGSSREKIAIKARYDGSLLTLISDSLSISAPSDVADYPADAICCLTASSDTAIMNVYSVAFYLGE